MEVLIVQHIACEPAGWWEEFLRADGVPIHTVQTGLGEAVPHDPAGYDAVFSMGGPMNVWQEAEHPWLRDENILIQNCLRNDVPFMGICLGSQLLCKAAGGEVVKSPAQEIGLIPPVNLTPEGIEDYALFAGLPPRFPVFQWHGDMFVPPRDSPFGPAARLAISELVPQQALRVGKRAYGLQFHVEVTPAMVVDWTNEYQEEVRAYGIGAKRGGDAATGL